MVWTSAGDGEKLKLTAIGRGETKRRIVSGRQRQRAEEGEAMQRGLGKGPDIDGEKRPCYLCCACGTWWWWCGRRLPCDGCGRSGGWGVKSFALVGVSSA